MGGVPEEVKTVLQAAALPASFLSGLCGSSVWFDGGFYVLFCGLMCALCWFVWLSLLFLHLFRLLLVRFLG